MLPNETEGAKPPTTLDYGRTKPLGYQAIQKLTRFFPITSLPNSDIIRFIVNSTGYWDPYSSYLRITVQSTNTTAAAPDASAENLCQMDNSASSLIQTLSFIQNGVELERIDRYEVLASILHDMYYSSEQRQQRAHEGFGCGYKPLEAVYSNNIGCMPSPAAPAFGDMLALGNTQITNISGLPTCYYNPGFTGAQVNLTCPAIPQVDIDPVYFAGANEPTIWSSVAAAAGNIRTRTFTIPIISGIFGVLMPADEIKYIPMIFFPNLEMNFRLNPYAMHNINPAMGARNFQVINCEMFVNIIHFAPEVNSAMVNLVKERGLYLHTCSYYYGPSHMIAAGASLETYPINMSFKSLRNLIWCFVPSDYRTRPYVREIRRKALNCTAAQVRIGGDLYPTFPIGNLGANSSSGTPWTNADFLANTYKAFGRFHDTINDSLVNIHTFCVGNYLTSSIAKNPYNGVFGTALNDSVYLPDLVRGFAINNSNSLSPGTAAPGLVTVAANNVYCAFTNNSFLANQIVPRAVYGIDLDTITSDDSVISGINTLLNKPFELLLEGTNPTLESCELNMWFYYDMVVMIDKDFTIKYLGRGG